MPVPAPAPTLAVAPLPYTDQGPSGGGRAPESAEERDEQRLTRSVLLLLLLWHLCEWLLRHRLCSHFTSAVGEGKLLHGVALERITPHRVAFAHVAATITFAVSFAITLTLRQWSRHPVKRSLTVCVCFVNWVSFFTYAHHVHMTGIGPSIASAGIELFAPMRLLQWSATTPMLLFACSTLAGNSQQVRTLTARAVVCDLAMVFLGAVERYAGHAVLSALGFAASSIAFLATMLFAQRLFRVAGQALSSAEDATSLGALWRHTLTVWTLFPLARLCAIAGVFGPNLEELAMILLDVVAKTAYSVVLMVGTFTLIDAVTVHRLTRAEELLAMLRRESVAEGALVDGLALACREAEGWRVDREQRLVDAGVPREATAAFLDAAVAEYVALAHGRLGAWGLPVLRAQAGA